MFRALALTICLALPLAGSGCAIVEVGMRNPVVGLETVAVAPFFNLSQERTVDGREFALDYYAELQKVPGFEVLPVGVTERAMIENGISLTGPHDAVRLAAILDVDAVVVGAVTDYDPYNPRIGLKVAWYSPRQFLFLPNEDPTIPFFNRSANAPAKGPGRPKYSTARAQSPDDSDEWSSAEFQPPFDPTVLDPALVVEDGNWETVADPTASISEVLLAQAELPQLQPFLPDGTSLLVPVADATFPTLPLPVPVETPSEDDWQSQTIPISYQEFATSDEPFQAPPADEIVPVQNSVPTPPVEITPPLTAQPILPTEPALPGNASSNVSPEPVPQPASSPTRTPPAEAGPFVRLPAVAQPKIDNPFNRHLPGASNGVDVRRGLDQPVRDSAGGRGFQTPPRIAAAEPEFPGSTQDGSAQLVPPQPNLAEPGSPPAAMKTPLFPVQRPEMNPSPMPVPRSTVPALVYDEQVVVAPSDFEPTEPLMAYVRLFDATDRRLIARLSDYLELTGQLRSGDLEAYMKRSEFFRKFTAHVMISEMLQLHGGEARRQLVLKPRKYR